MRNMLLTALLGLVLSCVPVWAQQAGQKASEGEAAAPAEAVPAEVEAAEAESVGEAKEPEAKSGDSPEKPAPKPVEPESEGEAVVVESEGTGPVAAFWFVVPGRS